MRWWACAALLGCLGCGPSPTSVLVTIRASSAVAVADLILAVAFGEAQPNPPHELLQNGRAQSLPAQVIVEVPDETPQVSVLVSATTILGETVFGSNSASLVPHQQTALEVQLPLAGDGTNPDGGVAGHDNGAACVDGAECGSGHCSGGVCCDRACDGGPCETCLAAEGASAEGTCTPLGAGVTCRAAAGGCDLAEVCDGNNGACPPDLRAKASTVCRANSGICDVAEACDGTDVDCPADLSICPPIQYCDGMMCVPKVMNGLTCAADKECMSGHCSDGFCCDQACAGACDACSIMAGAITNGVCKLLPAAKVCRAARGLCDAAELCTGASGACPADVRKPANTVCRAARPSDPCDLVEVCSGMSDTCPADLKAPQQSASYVTSFGRDGFAGSAGGLGYQRVEGACYDDGTETRGFVSFGTAALPDGAAVLSSQITACSLGGPGAQGLTLYSTSFALPLASSAYGATVGPELLDLPEGGGTHTFDVPVGSVSKTAETQYELRWPEINCSTFHGRRWSSSQSTGQGAGCADRTPFKLDVTYCVP